MLICQSTEGIKEEIKAEVHAFVDECVCHCYDSAIRDRVSDKSDLQ